MIVQIIITDWHYSLDNTFGGLFFFNNKKKTTARGFCILLKEMYSCFYFSLQGLHAINLGDSGFIVIRDGCTVFRSPVQQHDFNFTYQLESGNGGDLPSSGQVS